MCSLLNEIYNKTDVIVPIFSLLYKTQKFESAPSDILQATFAHPDEDVMKQITLMSSYRFSLNHHFSGKMHRV